MNGKNEKNEKRSSRMMWVKSQYQWWNIEGPELQYVNKKTDSSFQRYKRPLQGWSQSIIKPTIGPGIIRFVSRQQIEVRFEETANYMCREINRIKTLERLGKTSKIDHVLKRMLFLVPLWRGEIQVNHFKPCLTRFTCSLYFLSFHKSTTI